MITSIIIMLVLFLVNTFYICLKFNKKFEEIIPITAIAMILIVYLFGLIGLLKIGVYANIAISFVSFILSCYHIYKNKLHLKQLKVYLTPGLLMWLILYAFFCLYFAEGGYLIEWDEFTHWGTVVKSMFLNNDLSTGNGVLWFQNYPPGISIFQYMFQVVNGTYSEPLLYIAYQVLYISLVTYFTKNISFKEPVKLLLVVAVIMGSPLIMFTNAFASIYVDSILGITFGYFMTLACFPEKDNKFYWLNVFLTIFLLLILKDSGKLFAAIGIITIIANNLVIKKKEKNIKKFLKDNRNILICIAIFIVTVLSWNLKVKFSNITNMAFSSQATLQEIIATRRGVILRFVERFLGATNIPMFLIDLTALQFLGVFMFAVLLINKHFKKDEKKNFKKASAILGVGFLVYAAGLLLIYLFKFNLTEALGLASYDRYLKTYLTAFIIFVMYALIRIYKNSKANLYILLLVILVAFPFSSLYINFFTKYNIYEERISYANFTDSIKKVIKDDIGDDGKTKIYICTAKDEGYNYFILSYSLLEVMSKNNSVFWNDELIEAGDEGLTEAAEETNNKIIAEWQEEIFEYDYLVIYDLKDEFIETHGNIFENQNDITAYSLFKINKETRLLEKVDIS